MIWARLRELWVWVMLGSMLGILGTAALVPIGLHEYERRSAAFDRDNPIVSGSGVIIERNGESVSVEVVAKRLRGECIFDRASGASEDAEGRLTATYISRLGPGPSGVSYPAGAVSVSQWRLWPVAGAKAVHVLGLYMCDGRPVSATVARVALPEASISNGAQP